MKTNASFSLLRDGTFACELIPSSACPIPSAASLSPGTEMVVVTPLPLARTQGSYAMHLPNGFTTPVEILGSRIGVDGWNTSIRIREPAHQPV